MVMADDASLIRPTGYGLFKSSFSFATFIFIGVMPILGYWLYYLFIHKK
jgi:hypothetical protein